MNRKKNLLIAVACGLLLCLSGCVFQEYVDAAYVDAAYDDGMRAGKREAHEDLNEYGNIRDVGDQDTVFIEVSKTDAKWIYEHTNEHNRDVDNGYYTLMDYYDEHKNEMTKEEREAFLEVVLFAEHANWIMGRMWDRNNIGFWL